MYKVLIVEDEPPIIRYVNRLIQNSDKEFSVVGTAENGLEALEKIKLLQPDLVITDIKMPVMDGLQLIKKISALYPEVLTIIVSGYQDFEYAKEGLKAGAVDYLLKPLDPIILNNILSEISMQLDKKYRAESEKIIIKLIHNESIEPFILEKYLNYSYFAAIGVRWGPLPSIHLSIDSDSIDSHLLCHLKTTKWKQPLNSTYIWLLGGRDENEVLIVAGSNSQNHANIKKTIDSLVQAMGKLSRFHTIVHTPHLVKLVELSTQIRMITNTIDNLTVIGKDQLLESAEGCKFIENTVLNSALEKKLSFLINNRIMDGLKNELVSLFAQWEKDSKTQIWVEKMSRQILYLVEKSVVVPADFEQTAEGKLSEALFYSNDFAGILRCLWDIIEDTLSPVKQDKTNSRESTDILYQNIIQFIQSHLTEPLTLQELCNIFGISQPYLSRLFRKYAGISFKDYLTDIRIKEAISLMKEPQNILLKDIALLVGYEDPFYFSKVFKSVTGCTPSEYLKEITC